MTATPLFGYLSKEDMLLSGSKMPGLIADAITDAQIMRGMQNASTITLQLADPYRYILRSNVLGDYELLTADGLNFVMVEIAKASDQLSVTFEAQAVNKLRHHSGALVYKSTTDLGGFAQLLCSQAGVPCVSDPSPLLVATPIARGSGSAVSTIGTGFTKASQEDSWTCLTRLATTTGWRCFESAGTIYMGPDPWLMSRAVNVGTIQEFTDAVQDIDVDWDIGKPVGQASVTAMTGTWQFGPADVVNTEGMGKLLDRPWLVFACQRDLFNPQASITLQVPMTAAQVVAGVDTTDLYANG